MGSSRLGGTFYAVRFADGKIIDLATEIENLGDWTLWNATSISDTGVIVGESSRIEIRHGLPKLIGHGYMLVPITEGR